ncbi:MAG TPA: hypothetical protein VGN23_07355 [Verrucomicrobiae bacterium]|jgi:hypothetical protein
MKCWAVYTVLIYALALLFLTAPVVYVAFADWGLKPDGPDWKGILGIYTAWGYWIWLAVLMAGQALLLLLPIDISQKRLPSRRKLKVPVIVSAFFLANLFMAGIFSILCAIFTDNAFSIFSFADWIMGGMAGTPSNAPSTGWGIFASIVLPIVVLWFIWGIIFSNFAKSDSPEALLNRAVRWLLRGSILELIVAVPSHVIVRRRDDCCAPLGTFWGIATGISVMLLCFGPGVYFLFVQRMQRLRPKAVELNKPDSN